MSAIGILALGGCAKEDFSNPQNANAKLNGIKIEQKSFEELLGKSDFNKSFSKVVKKSSVTLQTEKTALEEQNGFTINEDAPIKIITQADSTVIYTMLIERLV